MLLLFSLSTVTKIPDNTLQASPIGKLPTTAPAINATVNAGLIN